MSDISAVLFVKGPQMIVTIGLYLWDHFAFQRETNRLPGSESLVAVFWGWEREQGWFEVPTINKLI